MLKKSKSPVPTVTKSFTLTFPQAIEAVIGGKKVRRIEWSDEGEYCLLKDSYLEIHRNEKFHTWIVSEGDMLATDWVII